MKIVLKIKRKIEVLISFGLFIHHGVFFICLFANDFLCFAYLK